jgi:hydrogenase maturation factor
MPAQIVEVEAHAVVVRLGREASTRLVEARLPPGVSARAGDWVLVHAGLVLGKIAEEEVDPLLELMGEIQPGVW